MAITKNLPEKGSRVHAEFSTTVQSKEHRTTAQKLSRVIVHYDVGFYNNLFIRGSGANLSWDKGIALQNRGPDEWVWETDLPFETCEFKILINDSHYEQGDNHVLNFAKSVEHTPVF